jgi:hypothetical protein
MKTPKKKIYFSYIFLLLFKNAIAIAIRTLGNTIGGGGPPVPRVLFFWVKGSPFPCQPYAPPCFAGSPLEEVGLVGSLVPFGGPWAPPYTGPLVGLIGH